MLPTNNKTFKVTGATISLAWAIIGTTIVVSGSLLNLRQKSKNLAIAIKS